VRLCANLDCLLPTALVVFLVGCVAMNQARAAALAAALWLGWVTGWCFRNRLRALWLRMPGVKQYHKRRWLNHARWIAGRQKAGLGAFCWGKALSDIPEQIRGEFVRDIQRLSEELGRPAAPDKNRKEQQ
jgi:hypothetical protein